MTQFLTQNELYSLPQKITQTHILTHNIKMKFAPYFTPKITTIFTPKSQKIVAPNFDPKNLIPYGKIFVLWVITSQKNKKGYRLLHNR